MMQFFVFPRRNLSSPLLLITSLQTQQFHAITHSFAQRRSAISPIFSDFGTPFIATGVGTPLSPDTPVQNAPTCQWLFSSSSVFIFLRTAFPATPFISQPSTSPRSVGAESPRCSLRTIEKSVLLTFRFHLELAAFFRHTGAALWCLILGILNQYANRIQSSYPCGLGGRHTRYLAALPISSGRSHRERGDHPLCLLQN